MEYDDAVADPASASGGGCFEENLNLLFVFIWKKKTNNGREETCISYTSECLLVLYYKIIPFFYFHNSCEMSVLVVLNSYIKMKFCDICFEQRDQSLHQCRLIRHNKRAKEQDQ